MTNFHCHACNKPLQKTWNGQDPKWCSERCRRTQYAGECVDCGKATNGHNGPGSAAERCTPCARTFNTRWTPEAIVDAIRAWAAEHGEIPKASVWLHESDGSRPTVHTVQRVFGSWNAGIAAAGMTPRARGRYGRPVLGVSDNTVIYRLDKAGCPRRSLREAQALRRAAA